MNNDYNKIKLLTSDAENGNKLEDMVLKFNRNEIEIIMNYDLPANKTTGTTSFKFDIYKTSNKVLYTKIEHSAIKIYL